MIVVSPCSAAEYTEFKVWEGVSGGVLNLRSGPGMDHEVIVSISAGSTGLDVDTCRFSDDSTSKNQWCHVIWKGNSGWVSACCITKLTKIGNIHPVNDGPTVTDAHALLSDIIGSGAVHRYARDGHILHLDSYSERAPCAGEIGYHDRSSDGTISVEWRRVTSVDGELQDVYLWGAFNFAIGGKNGVLSGYSIIVPDEITQKRVTNAIRLLIARCGGRSIFDY